MPTKLQRITELHAETLENVTAGSYEWTRFLSAACMNYKLPFDEQLLVYAQRPDATAVLELEKWNRNFDRWIIRGSKGITVLGDESASGMKHYFDITQTTPGTNSRPVPIWKMQPSYEAEVIEALEAAFGELADTDGIEQAIVSAAANVAEDNLSDYLDDLAYLLGDAAPSKEDMLSLLKASVTYMALERCDLDPWVMVDGEDFAALSHLRDPRATTILGAAVSQTAKMVIREIAATVLVLEREGAIRTIAPEPALRHTEGKPKTETVNDTELSERNQDGTDLSRDGGRLPVAKLGSTDGGDTGNRDVGTTTQEVPEGTSSGALHSDEDQGDTVQPSGTVEPTGRGDVGAAGTADGDSPRRERGDEAQRPDALGGTDERNPQSSDRDSEPRPDLLLVKPPGEPATQTPHERADDNQSPALSVSGGSVDDYRLPLGTSIFIGSKEYELGELSEDKVSLVDPLGPLFPLDMDRDEFERRLVENPLNDHLRGHRQSEVTEPTATATSEHIINFELPDDFDFSSLVGHEITEGDRHFVVDEINTDTGKVVLADATFQEDTGFPIFRNESLEWLIDRIANEAALDYIDMFSGSETPTPVQPAEEKKEAPEPQVTKRHNYTITNDDLGRGGAKERYHWNVDAIRTLQAIEAEGRLATPDEQQVLSRYVGWGALPQAFDNNNGSWTKEYVELKELLTDEEYTSARTTTLNAHYTSPVVIKAIYKAIENMGFTTGNVLEPSCGIGNFLGLVPEAMKESRFYGVEIDATSASIARQLYQTADIRCTGFEDVDFPDSFFDVAIGNVPFGGYSLADKRYDKHHFLVHDYFFAKTLDKVRAGGVVAFITSKGTLDKRNPAVRRYIAERAELIGAIRLPNNAFKDNAGTEVTADIIFLRKRDYPVATEPEWVHLSQTEDGVPVNQYFEDNPEMVLGRMVAEDKLHGRDGTSCVPYEGADLSTQLDEAITHIRARITDFEREDDEAEADGSIPADPTVRNFSYTMVSDKPYYREDSRMYPQELSATALSRVKGLVAIRDCVRSLIELQSEDGSDESITQVQTELNALYDRYTAKYGLINSRGNSMVFAKDSSYPLLASLEDIDEDGRLRSKAAMFTERTIRPYMRPTSADTPAEALAISLAERACVDIDYMAKLCNTKPDKIVLELKGVIYKLPGHDFTHPVYQSADEYLSGNVREKLQHAEWSAAGDPELQANVEALRAALPKDLTASEINVRLGATWIPQDDIEDFVFELLSISPYQRANIHVRYLPSTAQWTIGGKGNDSGNELVRSTYGLSSSKYESAYYLIEDALNLKNTRIFMPHPDDPDKRILDKRKTAIAQAKQEIIRTKFQEWVWSDPERRTRLCRLYNDTFNSLRLREFDGSHLTFPGMNPEIHLNEHQTNAVARIMYGGNSLLAHVVGAGKTFTMAAAAQEMKRVGLCSKSMIVVPNHLTEQWASEYLTLYPSANILVTTKRDFEKKSRRRFCARIATGDYDAVIIGHSQFDKIPVSHARQCQLLQEQIDDITDGISQLKGERGTRDSVKQLESARKRLEAKLKKLNSQERKDDTLTFEELGIDRLFVDESHFYKNLFLYTKMRNVGGISQTEAQKSSDLFLKCRYLDEKTDGKGVIFATGTPISNSMVELYTVQRYLQYFDLRRLGLTHFDCWASTFGETVTAIELSPEGTGYRQKTRFSKFYNLPELMALFGQVADIQTADMLSLPVPECDFHNVSVKPTEMQRELVAGLGERADMVRSGAVPPEKDNMLVITNDGRKLALDQRLINPMLPDDPQSKVNACIDNVYRIWEHHADTRQAQLVFCDLSTPKTDGSFDVYNDIKRKLIKRGVPEDEVAFIHDANTEARKAELFAKVRSGSVRVLLGSTAKMGAGTNVQERLIAIHDLDCPWRPSDLEQRRGRIVRQGNTNERVEVYRYVTENTFDSYLWQLVEGKQRFIGQIMTSKSPVRSAEDVDEQALSYAEIKALATGNPLIKERMDLDVEVARLKMLKVDFLSQRYAQEDRIIKYYPQQIKLLEERSAGYAEDVATASASRPTDKEHFTMIVGDITYTDKKEAGEAILLAAQQMTRPETIPLGSYAGFALEISFDKISREHSCILVGSLHHTVALGTDTLGNITRIDNALDNLQKHYDQTTERLANTRQQLENAKTEVDKPFDKEDELLEKTARLAELDALLNMDERESETIDDGRDDEDELDAEPERERSGGIER